MKALKVILLLAAAAASVACGTKVLPSDEPQMGIVVEMPGPVVSKADIGEIPPASEAEYKLHSLKIWAFTSEDKKLVAYLDLDESEFPAPGRTRNYSVPVTRAFATASPRPSVDVFALANEASVGISGLGRETTWTELHEASFGGSWFGTDPLVRIPDSSLGLPMSAMGLNMEVKGDEPVLTLDPVQLRRMVSKMRFIFCRMENANDHDVVSVNSITINGNMIPVTEHVFALPNTKYDIVKTDGYVFEPFTIPGPTGTLARNSTPEKLTWAGQNALNYDNLINSAVEAGIVSDAGSVYLRESDKDIRGRISYTINGKELERNFYMTAPGDFGRNHSWIVYGYFLSGRNIQISVNALPWDYNSHSVSFKDGLQCTSQFTVDDTTVEQVESSKDHFDNYLRNGVTAKGFLSITTPEGGQLYIEPVGEAWAFEVKPDVWDINPAYQAGRVDVTIRRNPNIEGDLTGKSITLSFKVMVGERVIDANSDVLNGKEYRFIL